jgi:hypothetical protein
MTTRSRRPDFDAIPVERLWIVMILTVIDNSTGYQRDLSAALFGQTLFRQRRRIYSRLGPQLWQGSSALGFPAISSD